MEPTHCIVAALYRRDGTGETRIALWSNTIYTPLEADGALRDAKAKASGREWRIFQLPGGAPDV